MFKKRENFVNIFIKLFFILEIICSLLKRLFIKSLGYIFGVWRMFFFISREEVILEVFFLLRVIREDLLRCSW